MKSCILLVLCVASLAYADYTVSQIEDMSVKVMDIKRSVEFTKKIAKIELEMQVYSAQAGELAVVKDPEQKKCVQDATSSAVASQGEVIDTTVGKVGSTLNGLTQVVMNADKATTQDWDQVQQFLGSFNLNQYKKETRADFANKLQGWIAALLEKMKACAKQ